MKNSETVISLKADLLRYYNTNDIRTFFRGYFTNSTVRWLCAYRCLRGAGFYKILGKVLYRFNRVKHRIQISPQTKIGGDCILDMEGL